MEKELTIIIPCKNEEKYIGGLFLCLLQQDLGKTKIIVADANSTDRTLSIVNSFKDRLNIEIIVGGSVSVGRNNGAQIAKTPYLLFLDADVRLFNKSVIKNSLQEMKEKNLDLATLNIKNYGKEFAASIIFDTFNIINKIMTKSTPFAIGAFFLTKRSKFEEFGGFAKKYDTSEDYILSKKYDPKKFKIMNDYFGQDERRFKRLGYFGMCWYMAINFLNRHNLKHFEKVKVNYWD